jgi:hypothetical protein
MGLGHASRLIFRSLRRKWPCSRRMGKRRGRRACHNQHLGRREKEKRDARRFMCISEPTPALPKRVRVEWEEEWGYGSDDDSVGVQD